jgi:NADPH:quinone reductase-like Zn-dependent oxidoreductase
MGCGHNKEVVAKIVQFHEKGGPEVLELKEVTLSSVTENDVRFRVRARLAPSRV